MPVTASVVVVAAGDPSSAVGLGRALRVLWDDPGLCRLCSFAVWKFWVGSFGRSGLCDCLGLWELKPSSLEDQVVTLLRIKLWVLRSDGV